MANLSTLLERHMLTAQSKGLSGSQLVDDRLTGSTHGSTEPSITTSLEPADPPVSPPQTLNQAPQESELTPQSQSTTPIPQAAPFQPDDPQPEEIQWRRSNRPKRSKRSHTKSSYPKQPAKIQVPELYPRQDLVLLPAVVNWQPVQDRRDCCFGSGCETCFSCGPFQRCYSTTVYFDQNFTDTIEALNDCLDDTVEGPPLCHYLGLVASRFLKDWWQRLVLRLDHRVIV